MQDCISRVSARLRRLPRWSLTILVLAGIAWLTLMPVQPEAEPPRWLAWLRVLKFDGADKIAHTLMFGALTVALLIDLRRRCSMHIAMACAVVATAIGYIIEVLQRAMALGRSYDLADVAADAVGAFLFAILATLVSKKHPSNV